MSFSESRVKGNAALMQGVVYMRLGDSNWCAMYRAIRRQ